MKEKNALDLDFEEFCRRFKLKPLDKTNHRKANIYIAERYTNGDRGYPKPSYHTIAIFWQDRAKYVDFIYTDFGKCKEDGTLITQDDRRKAILAIAKRNIDNWERADARKAI